MNDAERLPYLKAGDSALAPLGFSRKKKEQEWRRAVDSAHVEWLHLNFGRAVINPSFGVLYSDLGHFLPPQARSVFGTAKMLSSITGRSYSSDDTPATFADDLLLVVPELGRFRDRGAVINALMSDSSEDWPLYGFSARIRVLPALLAATGRISESMEWLGRFEAIAPERDQMVPGYDVFSALFRKEYAA